MRLRSGWLVFGLLMLATACAPRVVASPATLTPSPDPTRTAMDIPTPPAVTIEPPAVPSVTPTQPAFDPAACAPEACTLEGDFWLQRPAAPPAQQTVDGSYLYGTSQNGQRIVHSGVEFYNASGTPVLAAADGNVFFAGNDEGQAFAPWTRFYGNLVILEHVAPDGSLMYSLYAHLSEIDVEAGARIRAGQEIGKVGMTGSAIGSHLHFELRTDPEDYSTTRNPLLYLAPLHNPQGTPLAVLAGRLIDANGQNIATPLLVAERLNLPETAIPERYYIETYAAGTPSAPAWQENFVLADLEPGHYRISFVFDGRLIERFVTLSAGKLTYLSLQLEN
ncbi:MAG: M23 family metallopeptidase [Chloroflexi bacterium]|nr:M23 family metallopeptidase [Chloroflexota bacterium]